MTHVPTTPSGNELPQLPPPEATLPDMSPAATLVGEVEEVLISRRSMLGTIGRSVAVVTTVAVELSSPTQVSAETDQPADDQPGEPPTAEPLTPEEKENIEAETRNFDADTKLKEIEFKRVEDSLKPRPWLQEVGDTALKLSAVGAIGGGVLTAGLATQRYFANKKQEREAATEAQRIEENEQRIREDENYDRIVDSIADRLKDLASLKIDYTEDKEIPSYEPLLTTYSQLETFAVNPRFAERVFNLTVARLRGRAKGILKWHPDQIEARANADREVVRFLVAAHENLPREDTDGNTLPLPDAAGISFDHLRFLRAPMNNLNLEGAWMRGLTITGSLASSRLRLVHFEGSTFGEPEGETAGGGICDWRGADLSRADLNGAVLAHILIDKETKFGEGKEGNPCVSFGKVTSESMEPEEIDEKIAAAQKVIDEWQKDHSGATVEQTQPPAGEAASKLPARVRKVLGVVGIGKARP
jgi:hypothetical protein